MSLAFASEYMNIVFIISNVLVILCFFVAVSKFTEFSCSVIQRIGFSFITLGLSINLLARIELATDSDILAFLLVEIPFMLSSSAVQIGLGVLALNHIVTLFFKKGIRNGS